MKKELWVIVMILSLLALNIVTFQPASCKITNMGYFGDFRPEPPPWNILFPYLLIAKTVLSSVNSILLVILLTMYIGIYRKTRSEFSIGLVIFSMALLLYSLTSNPLIHRLAGFRIAGLGPFTMLPDLFTLIASAVLLYLSRQ